MLLQSIHSKALFLYNKPMSSKIILIGGSSHVGKTLIAQKLLERTGFPYLSLDHLKMGLIRSGRTDLTPEDDYEMRYFLWPLVAEMIKTAIENDQNMIVEGCYIPGEWKDSFSREYLSKIYCTFITMSEEYLRKNIKLVEDKANVIEHRLYDEVDLERLILCSKEFKTDCQKYAIPNLEIDENTIYDADAFAEKILKEAAF